MRTEFQTAPDNALPAPLEQQVNAELRPAERILWSEQPAPRLLSMKTVPIVLFGIPWTVFSCFWVAAATFGVTRAESFNPLFLLFPLFGVPFILVGFGMLSTPLRARRAARKSLYVLTDKRAISFEAGSFGKMTIRSYEAGQLANPRQVLRGDGSGDVYFGFEDATSDDSSVRTSRGIGFTDIRDVRAVEALARSVAAKALPAKDPQS